MRLLQSTWAELLTLTTAYRSLEQFTDSRDNSDIGDDESSLKLRYATDYWLDERLARDCCPTPTITNITTTSTTTSSTTCSTTTTTMPTVLDIYNLVCTVTVIIAIHFNNNLMLTVK